MAREGLSHVLLPCCSLFVWFQDRDIKRHFLWKRTCAEWWLGDKSLAALGVVPASAACCTWHWHSANWATSLPPLVKKPRHATWQNLPLWFRGPCSSWCLARKFEPLGNDRHVACDTGRTPGTPTLSTYCPEKQNKNKNLARLTH